MTQENNELIAIIKSLSIDTINKNILLLFCERYQKGLDTYGITLDDASYSTEEWITHTQEELADAMLYLEKLKTKIKAVKEILNV